MSLEGIQQHSNQQYGNNNLKKVSIPKELKIPGTVSEVQKGGLIALVATGLAEIKKDLEKKLDNAKKKISSEVLSMLGIEGAESGEEPGGLETVKRGLREVWKNLQMKLNNDDR
ncbi:MAG: hypothetical protein DKM50_07285 [Candidatus Margulisiibacteriota bacterium]|nr:MAG: hypothetical protein A2X43_12775 [Candidatus Margulisbacteria bacterium GWD2_39_127]OGI02104.1 MAG: hypothetical protein A2X42_01390 [Candidatus Margulisbacteria bacterium GWF2_38_17]OGI10481.1 MAG: hypothetical protein A2X41_06890 [Candidatus Margulisbacteria bacterium GWE2_39_32]PZM79973.1 MAG: hypothetical protein DKM50_07285 [Candidatus Margulisiibacteriota bacterium]HAR62439.1 hypothetical protein [Candidatus Margulisiibacteriota bacterium]